MTSSIIHRLSSTLHLSQTHKANPSFSAVPTAHSLVNTQSQADGWSFILWWAVFFSRLWNPQDSDWGTFLPFIVPGTAMNTQRRLERCFRPRRCSAYSTSFPRLDGTVARAKSGLSGRPAWDGEEREQEPGALPCWVWFSLLVCSDEWLPAG